MDRRDFLALSSGIAGMSLPGCLGLRDRTGLWTPWVSVGDVADPGHDIGFDVEVTRQFDTDGPAELDVVATNESTELREFRKRGTPPVLDTRTIESDGENESLLIGSADIAPLVPEAPTDDCWRAPWLPGIEDFETSTEVAPDQAIGGSHVLLAPPADYQETCMPPGEYHVESELGIRSPGAETTVVVSLWFSLWLDKDGP